MTNGEMITKVRKPGKVYMTILMPNDMCRMPVEKAFLIDMLKQQNENDECAWYIVYANNDYTVLDANS